MSMKQLNIKDFFETQFKSYAVYDSERSIANAIDGFKITARKAIYTSAIRSNTEIKVAQLSAQVAYETAYHHGEASVGGVICNLAQNFTGTNNINFLEPIGQFGSRLSPIPAAHRYIFTKLSSAFRDIFKKEDDLILEYNYDDDQKIEPKFYLPILPVVLINGTQGIGTGFASKILSYNPKDIRDDILAILTKKKRKPLIPWFRNFSGEVIAGENKNQWIISGKLEIVDSNTILITELPVGSYLDDIKNTLNKLKEKDYIKDYDDNSSEEAFHIEVNCPRTTTSLPLEKLYDLFKLTTKETENLTLWNHNDKLQVFDSASELVSYFVQFRLDKYEQRRLALIKQTEEEILWLDEKIRFINFYLNNHTFFKNNNKEAIFEELTKNEFTRSSELLSMQILSLTKDKIEELQKELDAKLKHLESLSVDTPDQMYERELKELKPQ